MRFPQRIHSTTDLHVFYRGFMFKTNSELLINVKDKGYNMRFSFFKTKKQIKGLVYLCVQMSLIKTLE